MAKILIFINHSLALYKFRKELPISLLKEGHEVFVCYPNEDKDDYFKGLGCKVIHFEMQRKSTNPFKENSNFKRFKRLCKEIQPDILLSYTIKCCWYGSYIKNVKKIATITGQSSFFKNSSGLKKILYHSIIKSLRKYDYIYFQNEKDLSDYSKLLKVNKEKLILVKGSGVNPEEHPYQGSINASPFVFTFVGRIIKEKGINEYLDAASSIKEENVVFNIAGPCEDDLIKNKMDALNDSRIHYLGDVTNINTLYKESSCIVVPSYSEGMSNALLEAQSSGRPVIASDIPGCREVFINDESGMLVKPRDPKSLYDAMTEMMKKSDDELTEMGVKGSHYVMKEFDRSKVINIYIETINRLLTTQNNK